MSAAAITFATGLRDGRPLRMAKRILLQHGRIIDVEPAPQAARFRFREVEASNLVTLMRAIWRAGQSGEVAVRGRPKKPEGRRAVHDDPERGPAGLIIAPRLWCAFDWDGLPAEGDPLREPEIGVRLALRILPPAFREVSCGWQTSASAGFKLGFRLRTWHMLDHPTTGAELKGWCRPATDRHLLDLVTLVEAQPHYLAVDVIGGLDPCPQRIGTRVSALKPAAAARSNVAAGCGHQRPASQCVPAMDEDVTLPALARLQGQAMPVTTVIRLEYRPRLEPGGYHVDKFSVFQGAEQIIKSTRSPLYAGARALLERGHHPAQLMTIRLGGRAHDSFVPAPIGELAKWTIEESDQRGLSRREWRSFSGRVAHDARRPSLASAAPEVEREAVYSATPGCAITMSEVDAT